MQKIQKYRFIVQSACLAGAIASFMSGSRLAAAGLVILTVFSGVFFCGWMCPFGFMQDIFSRISDILGIKRKKMPKSLQRVLAFSRYALFALVSLSASDFVFRAMSLDPRANFAGILSGSFAGYAALSVILVFLVASLFFDRPFCNYLCFEGAKYGLLSLFRIFTVQRDEDKCVGCKKCDAACPMNISVSTASSLQSPQCINCMRCVCECPVEGALSFKRVPFDGKSRKFYALAAASIFIYFSLYGAHDLRQSGEIERKPEAVQSEDSSSAKNGDGEFSNDASQADQRFDGSDLADGVYKGTGRGYKGDITISVVIESHRISSIEILSSNDDRRWFQRACSQVPQSIIDSQDTDVDLVSGATYSSQGIKLAVEDALEKAKRQ